MRKVLIPVEAGNPARSRAAVAEAIGIYSKDPVTVHLLSVQPAVSGHVAMFFGSGELHQLQYAPALRISHPRKRSSLRPVCLTNRACASGEARKPSRGPPGSWVATASSWARTGRAVSPPGCSVAHPTSPADRQRQW